MKGFVRILEAIIASLILIAVLPFFFPKPAASEWTDVVLQTQAMDAVAALHKSGILEAYVKSNDASSLNAEMNKLLPKTVDFSVEINGIPNPVILVGCVCTPEQLNDLEGILVPVDFTYRQRTVSIRVASMALDSIDPRTNVLLVFGYRNMTPYRSSLDKFLENGGTIFVFGDLTKSQTEDGIMNTTFGLTWDDALVSGPGRFSDPSNVTRASHRVFGYYRNVSGGSEGDIFGGFGTAGVNKIAADSRTVISGDQVSFVKVNRFIAGNGKGRTVWFAGYDYTSDSGDAQQAKNLTKASVMWASGESYKMNVYQKQYGKKFLVVKHLGVLDGFEPFEMSLIVWRVFF